MSDGVKWSDLSIEEKSAMREVLYRMMKSLGKGVPFEAARPLAALLNAVDEDLGIVTSSDHSLLKDG